MANGSSRDMGRRGGKKSTAPARPAAVSGPGKLARRTDSAVPSIQDVQAMASGTYGEEQQLVEQVRDGAIIDGEQEATPVAAAPRQAAPAPIGGVPAELADIFAPDPEGGDLNAYQRPQEQITLEPDDVLLIRAMAEANPTNELLGLLQFASQRARSRNIEGM